MNRERLKKTADLLRTIPPEKFNLGTWGECGSICCAAGWECEQKRPGGLEWANDLFHLPYPRFQDKHGWEALEAYYDIPSEAAFGLFADDGYPERENTRPAEVAAKIEGYILACSPPS